MLCDASPQQSRTLRVVRGRQARQHGEAVGLVVELIVRHRPRKHAAQRRATYTVLRVLGSDGPAIVADLIQGALDGLLLEPTA